MYDLYETEYNIFNHINGSNRRPLASVGYHDSESIDHRNLLSSAMRKYIDKNIKDLFMISFTDFIELPSEIINTMYEVAGTELVKKSEMLDEMKKNFK